MTDSALLIQESPMLLPVNKEKTIYDGFITVQENDFRIRILLPSDRQLKYSKLQCCWRLKQILNGYQHIIKQRLQHSSDLVSFILELKTVLEVAVKRRQVCQADPPPQYYCQLIGEMETLGWDKLLFIDTEFRTLKLRADDSCGRQHVIALKLKSKYPAEAPEFSADLPLPLSITWTPQSFSMECGICYSYRLDSAIPDQVCNAPRCGQPFHQACLYEWLRSLPSSRQSFNTVFGECPYCSKPVTVKVALQKP